MSVETRLKIIELLKTKGPIGVNKMAGILGITPAAVSQHLKVLRHAGFVRHERKGYWIPYSIDGEALENCRHILDDVCSCECGGPGIKSKQELRKARLDSLRKYKQELERELLNVKRRISEIKPTEK